MTRKRKTVSREPETLSENNIQNIKLTVKCKTPGQKVLVKSIREKEVTFCAGMAGTGKTYLACAQALKMLKAYQKL